MKILLAIDDSKFSEAAIRMVVAQNRPQDTEVLVLHVLESIEIIFPQLAAEYSSGYYPPEPVDLDKLREQRRKPTRELVADTAEKLRCAGFPVDTTVTEGDARDEIIDKAAEWHADLIVVGSHGRKGFDRFLLGSVSEFVTRHARCSVQIVRVPASSS